MTLWDIVKTVANAIVSFGTGVIISHYTGNAVKGAKGVYKACAAIAAIAIEGYASYKVGEYVNGQINNVQIKLEGPKKEEAENVGN